MQPRRLRRAGSKCTHRFFFPPAPLYLHIIIISGVPTETDTFIEVNNNNNNIMPAKSRPGTRRGTIVIITAY